MKKLIASALFLLVGSAMAQSSTTTGVNGNGVAMSGTAAQTLGGKMVTITVSPAASSLKSAPSGNQAGTSSGTFSAGLSIGKTLGGGSGNTGGTAGSTASAFSFK